MVNLLSRSDSNVFQKVTVEKPALTVEKPAVTVEKRCDECLDMSFEISLKHLSEATNSQRYFEQFVSFSTVLSRNAGVNLSCLKNTQYTQK